MLNFIVSISILIIIVVMSFASSREGILYENTRIYEQCIKDNNLKTVVDATELCKHITR